MSKPSLPTLIPLASSTTSHSPNPAHPNPNSAAATTINLKGNARSRPSASGRQPLLGVDVLGFKEQGQGLKNFVSFVLYLIGLV
ncbi:unnamed protein product [Arabidopsis lyrata]|uniref:Predicted protein n=1 Tax=Arabidopsis lyrata subsp. lyrata TaxID=81972 RepID=D7LG17_ARALL|nr:predicted protein [Arabidopsis lyrata subsp. lyrata]CAH8263258.1 unnamed protein product [Arabidopsis lyrata]